MRSPNSPVAVARAGAVLRWALVAAWMAAGCLRTPAVRYYTIPGDTSGQGAPVAEATHATVRVGAVSLPEALDRPQLVLRLSPTEVSVDDGHRWAEPLRTAIARAVAADLRRALPGTKVVFADEAEARGPADIDVTLDVERLDLEPGRGVSVEASWLARWVAGARTNTGRTVARVPVPSKGAYDALAAACGSAFASVSGDIARSLASGAQPVAGGANRGSQLPPRRP